MKNIYFTLFVGCSFYLGAESLAGPSRQIVVGADDTVYGVAYNNGIPTHAVISANNLKPPYTLKKGQVLVIPLLSEHIVGEGQTLENIAEVYGINIDVLAQENNIRPPFFIRPGDHLTIPPRDTAPLNEALKPPSQEEISTTALAPLPLVKSASAPAASPSSLTPLPLLKSASSHGTSSLPHDLAEELAREKGMSQATAVSDPSSKPMLMGNLAQRNAGASTGQPENSEGIKEKKKPKKESKKEEKKPEKKEIIKESKKEETIKEGLFVWPAEGEIISQFGPGGKNDGINIKIPEGTSVKAAADGTVMYAGNELKGFGNLLLLKHEGGWVTAYAHNSALLVKKGDKVKQGAEIAKSGIKEEGAKGDAGKPQLHFEIRKGKQPIDPLTKLRS